MKSTQYRNSSNLTVEITTSFQTESGDCFVHLEQNGSRAWVERAPLLASPKPVFDTLCMKGFVLGSAKNKAELLEKLGTLSNSAPGYAIKHPGWHQLDRSLVYVRPDGTFLGDFGNCPYALMFDINKDAQSRGKRKAWNKGVLSLMENHPSLLFLLGAVCAAPMQNLMSPPGTPLIIEIVGGSESGKTLLVHMLASFFGKPEDICHLAPRTKKELDDLKMRSTHGLLVLDNSERLPKALLHELRLIDDLSGNVSSGAKNVGPGTVIITSTKPLMDYAPSDPRLAERVSANFISLTLEEPVSEDLCTNRTQIMATLAENYGVAGEKPLCAQVAVLNEDENGLAWLRETVEKGKAKFRKNVENIRAPKVSQRALENCALIYAAADLVISSEGSSIVGSSCLNVFKGLSAQYDPTMAKIMDVLDTNAKQIRVRKDKAKEPIDLENDTLIYRHEVKNGEKAYWFDTAHLRNELGRNATRLLKDLKALGVLVTEDGKLGMWPPSSFGVKKRMCKIVLPEEYENLRK